MGYILTPIAVDLGQVCGAIGSKNKELISALVAQFGAGFAQFDRMAAGYAEDNELNQVLTMRSALTQMVMGEEYVKELGFIYGYALEFICRHFGEFLPNGEWSAMPSGTRWAEEVDQGLEAAGVPEKALRVIHHLMGRGAPVAIPDIDDFPGIGYLKLMEVKAAQKALLEAQLTSIDEEVLGSIRELQGWLETCSSTGRDLVCFYA
jgi:hypothetical protein